MDAGRAETAPGKTDLADYLRAATPVLAWPEINEQGLHARRWTIAIMRDRLEDDDPWTDVPRHGRSLTSAAKKLESLRQ